MPLKIDFDDLYQRMDALDVAIEFTDESGFVYLKEKLAEVVDKGRDATFLMIQLIRLSDTVQQEKFEQQALYQATGSQEHRKAALIARDQYDRLKGVREAAKLRRERLRALPQDIRLYANILEQALTDAGERVKSSKRTDALPGGSISPTRGNTEEEMDVSDRSGLFR